MHKPTSEKIKSMIVEVASIVAGVLLALAANEWNENRVHKAKASEALYNITQEIQSNIKMMTFVHENNQKTITLLTSQNDVEDITQTEEESQTTQFIPGLQIQDTAWKTLLSTGVSQYVDYDVLYQLSSVYSLQDIYKSLGYQFIQNMMATNAMYLIMGNPDNKIDDTDLYGTNMTLLVSIESGILASYNKAIDKLTTKGYILPKINSPKKND